MPHHTEEQSANPFIFIGVYQEKFLRHWPLAYSSREKLKESSDKVMGAGGRKGTI